MALSGTDEARRLSKGTGMTGTVATHNGQQPNDPERWVMAPHVLAAVEALLDELPKASGADDLVERMLAAQSGEGVNMDDGDTIKAERLYGERIIVESVKLLPSEHDESNLKFYLRVEGVRESGQMFAFSTGSQVAVIALAQLYKLGELPAVVTLSPPLNWRKGGTPPTNVKFIRKAKADEPALVNAWKDGGEARPQRETIAEANAGFKAKVAADKARRAEQTGPDF